MKNDKIDLFRKLARDYESVMFRLNKTTAKNASDKVIERLYSLAKEILSEPDGVKCLSGLTNDRNVFISGWSSMTILSYGKLSADDKNVFIELLRKIKDGDEAYSAYIYAYLVGNGYDPA